MITVVLSGAPGVTGSRVVGVGPPLAGQDLGTDFARLYGPPAGAGGLPRSSGSAAATEPAATARPRPGTSAAPSDGLVGGGPSPETAEPAWPVGSYAIAFRYRSDGPSVVRWVRVDIRPGTPTGG